MCAVRVDSIKTSVFSVSVLHSSISVPYGADIYRVFSRVTGDGVTVELYVRVFCVHICARYA